MLGCAFYLFGNEIAIDEKCNWIGDGEDVGLTGLPLRRSSGGKQGKEGSWQGLEMQLISFSFGFFR